MNCPKDNEKLDQILFHNVQLHNCPRCFGMWFEKGELNSAENDSDKSLNWVEIDLWKDDVKFFVSRSDKHCPNDRAGLKEITYGDSKTKVDFCEQCGGVWLDKGEFKQIINYLKQKADYDILNNYSKTLVVKLWEVFTGPKSLRDELEDLVTVIKLFKYKFLAQHPHIIKLTEDLPK
ncbi:MAG: hypothetical protein EXS48_03475 [Candidatus Staskawiczbacteria bacterium]|nr:hypothetical protein [Candidatus Staskawiczbacteria bacterium]